MREEYLLITETVLGDDIEQVQVIPEEFPIALELPLVLSEATYVRVKVSKVMIS